MKGTNKVRIKPLMKDDKNISSPQYRMIKGKVVSILVTPPEAIGAYLSILTSMDIVTSVKISLRRLTEKPKAPHSKP